MKINNQTKNHFKLFSRSRFCPHSLFFIYSPLTTLLHSSFFSYVFATSHILKIKIIQKIEVITRQAKLFSFIWHPIGLFMNQGGSKAEEANNMAQHLLDIITYGGLRAKQSPHLIYVKLDRDMTTRLFMCFSSPPNINSKIANKQRIEG